MRQIQVVALASTLMLAGFAAACRDGLKAPAEPNGITPMLVRTAPSGPYRPASLAALLQAAATRSTSAAASASRSTSRTASRLTPNFTIVESASDATTMNVNGSSVNPVWGAISNAGVTGSWSAPNGSTHAFFWSLATNSGTDLGTLATGIQSGGEAVNDNGDVVGWSEIVPNGQDNHHPFLSLAGGSLTDIGTLDNSDPTAWAEAYGVNNAGQVVGAARAHDLTQHAFLWDAATGMHDLGIIGNRCQAIGVSEDGTTVMGSYVDAISGYDRTWIWHTGDANPHDLDIFPGKIVFPLHMNAAGQIVGYMQDPFAGTATGFVYSASAGAMTVGSPSLAIAFGNNDKGDVVGTTLNSTGTAVVPMLWSAANGLQDLSGMLPSVQMLYGVNDNAVTMADGNRTYNLTLHPEPLAADASVQTMTETPVSVTVSASDPDGSDISYAITTDPQHGTVIGTGPSYTYTPEPGFSGTDSFAYTATATPQLGANVVVENPSVSATGHVTITVIANRPPVAIIGAGTRALAAFTGGEGSPIAFAGSGSDPDNDPITFAWSFGDGATASIASPTHAYADNGTYTATLTVTDSHGASGSATTQVVVTNVAPTGTFSGSPANLLEGDAFSLSIANATDPSAVDQKIGFQYAFDCGAGYGDWGSSATIQCATTDNTSLTVHAKVRDKDGGFTQYESRVTVNNALPKVAVSPTATVTSGDVYTFTGSFTDPGVNDRPWAYSVNWGVGSPTNGSTSSQGTISASQRYLAAGTYAVTLSVTDKDHGTGADTTRLTVLRLPVGLDVSPGDAANEIKLNEHSSKDVLVAVLSSAGFDARLVDVGTARIGGASVATKGKGYSTSVEDVNGDGRLDLVLHFNTSDLVSAGGLNASSKALTLLATLTDGRQITATDVVNPR